MSSEEYTDAGIREAYRALGRTMANAVGRFERHVMAAHYLRFECLGVGTEKIFRLGQYRGQEPLQPPPVPPWAPEAFSATTFSGQDRPRV